MLKDRQRYALLSVFDKTGIVTLAKTLISKGFTLIASGGTAKHLLENKVQAFSVEKFTGTPEAFDGRVKTLNFQIASGILFDRNNLSHRKQAQLLRIKPIDVVVCNLYPFEKEAKLENIDVGGVTLIRAAAKNFPHVLVITDPKDYPEVTHALLKNQDSFKLRRKLAAKAFAYTSFYDSLIAHFLEKEAFPEIVTIAGRQRYPLRYGENPHQSAALYLQPNTDSPLKNLKELAGRSLSLTNVGDINAGIESVRLFAEPCAAVIKHNTPCGIALGKTIAQALKRAIEADPTSAFGGTIVLNKMVDKKAAQAIASFKKQQGNIDIIAAPQFDENAFKLLQTIRKTMGIYMFDKIEKQKKTDKTIKWINGGFILQTSDYIADNLKNWEVVTKKHPTKKQLLQMKIAWKFISRIRSNAVIIVDKNLPMTRGIGSGQTSRIAATKIALEQAGKYAKGAILASDSFFPFDDSVKLAVKYGSAAIVQQGGSINDQASITAANKAGIPMMFTHRRAFWH